MTKLVYSNYKQSVVRYGKEAKISKYTKHSRMTTIVNSWTTSRSFFTLFNRPIPLRGGHYVAWTHR